ncbi:hypothetical protein AB0M42_21495 [Streptomyces sp. NPDC051784]|uniref:hypothetical protein n=1 Tax=Streptomyces sp. NPDC051784 TaxID=3155805 RepID=UPI0034335C81
MAVLETAIADDPRYCHYTFDATWGTCEEAALMENGSGDDFSVLFASAGVLIRGFDHESAMSPYGRDDEQAWPGVIDEVPAALRPLLDEPVFCDKGIDAPRVTACLWREADDTAWRTASRWSLSPTATRAAPTTSAAQPSPAAPALSSTPTPGTRHL